MNRLASNSLLEALVYGAHVGERVSQLASDTPDRFQPLPLDNPRLADTKMDEPLDVEDIRNSLKSLMWRADGVQREGKSLAEAGEDIEQWCRYVLSKQFNEVAGWELQNMLIVSRDDPWCARTKRDSRSSRPNRFS